MTQYPATTPFERNPGAETQVSYTAQGHTQKESNALESKEYEYNAAERLIRYASTEQGQSGPQIEASYRHDPFGRRIAKTVKQGGQTKTTYYIYSEQGLMAEADEKGQMTKAYGFNPIAAQLGLWSTDPVWQAETLGGSLTDPKARYDWLHTDHLGTPILATTKEGQVSWKAIAASFGSTQIIEQDIEMNLRFPGQYFDAETGTHYNFHRDYRPNAGRYLQGDPIKLRGGINLFNYANGNPLVKLDSMGLKTCGSGWNEIIVPDNPAYFQFSPCCEEHDNCYGDCYGPSKSVCDLNFFNCMQKTCNALVDNIYVWYICSEIANSYYSAVNKWGDESFYAARNKRNDCFPRPSEILPRFRSWSY